MLDALWLTPTLPLAGFLILALAGHRLNRTATAVVGVGSVGVAFMVAAAIAVEFLGLPASQRVYHQTLWSWLQVGGLDINVSFFLDALSLVLLLVVTGVGFLIHLFSSEFMAEETDYSRYFAYLNLFVAAMLILILGENLVMLFLGWEGVGLCSYLLIGYWHSDPANGYAARKAFVVTRAGDTAMLIGLFLLFQHLDTLHIQTLLSTAPEVWDKGSSMALIACLLLVGGAVGKSAQLPLQVWLPDAMAGPSPVSALIHAATMVTAGVYLIARMHDLFLLAPAAMLTVAFIGAATLLIAGFAALGQHDIKRILAYSTISQIGYMFLALGVGAWSAAIFHLVTHAFFKAMLFLAAGVVIWRLDDEHDIFRMGGLRRQLPLTFAAILVGSASLAALPLVTAGFYSKDLILLQAWAAPEYGGVLWAAGSLGALITGIYVFRMVFTAFWGEPQHADVREELGWRIRVPLVVLLVGSIAGGWLSLPLGSVFPSAGHGHHPLTLQILAGLISVAGIAIAWWLYGRRRPQAASESGLARFLERGLGFDALYDTVIVRPFVTLAARNRRDFIDSLVHAVAALNRRAHQGLVLTQNGQLRFYALMLVVGAILMIAMGGFV